jgi:hypothetical protein
LNAYRTRIAGLRSYRLAGLTPLGLVLKAFVGEKHLLAGGENEFSPAFPALQDLIVVFHTLLRDLVCTGQGAVRVRAREFLNAGIHSRRSYARWHEIAWTESSFLDA